MTPAGYPKFEENIKVSKSKQDLLYSIILHYNALAQSIVSIQAPATLSVVYDLSNIRLS